MTLFVAGLPSDFDDTDLREMFELYGEVSSARIVTDRDTRKSKGFGFVEMPDTAEAKLTIQTLDGVTLRGGKQLAVKEAETPSRRGNNRDDGFAAKNFPNSRPRR